MDRGGRRLPQHLESLPPRRRDSALDVVVERREVARRPLEPAEVDQQVGDAVAIAQLEDRLGCGREVGGEHRLRSPAHREDVRGVLRLVRLEAHQHAAAQQVGDVVDHPARPSGDQRVAGQPGDRDIHRFLGVDPHRETLDAGRSAADQRRQDQHRRRAQRAAGGAAGNHDPPRIQAASSISARIAAGSRTASAIGSG